MENSILTTIKQMLGLEKDYTAFDIDVIVDINASIFKLHQLGIGATENFRVTGYDETWDDVIGDVQDIEALKTYVYLNTRILFDPPTSSYVVDAMNNQMRELEWRLLMEVEIEE